MLKVPIRRPIRRKTYTLALSVGTLLGAAAFLLYRVRPAAPIVAVIPATTAQELSESEHAGVTSVTEGTRWRVYWNGPDDPQNVDQQIKLLQHVESMGVSGVILTPDHPLALDTEVSRIAGRGIPTVVVSTALSLEPSSNLQFVLNDDAVAAKMAADYIGHLLKEHGSVALIGDDPDIRSSSSRASLFAVALHAEHPGIELVAKPRGTLRFGEAEQQIEDIVHQHPHLNAIISIGILETRTAVATLRGLGRRNDVALIGFDQDLDLMYELRHGGIKAILAQDTFRMGELAMGMILRPDQMKHRESVIRVAPILVTPENIDTADIQRALSMDWRHEHP